MLRRTATAHIDETGGSPLRCCLRLSVPGETTPCTGHLEPGWPPDFRNRSQVLRAYDSAGRIAAAVLVDGKDAEPHITALLQNPEHQILHSRNVLYGCFMFTLSNRKPR